MFSAGTVAVTGGLLAERMCSARLLAIALAHGVAYAVFVAAAQPVSGGHLNQAVTLAALMSKHIRAAKAVLYMLSQCAGAYDRAALVALPAEMRARYARHVYGQLGAGWRGLLITLDYPQAEMEGPPFSVPDDEVQRLYEGVAPARLIDRRGILEKEPKFAERGVTRLDTLVYRLGEPDAA